MHKEEGEALSRPGVYSRSNFRKRFREELNRALRYEGQLSILFLDLDHFKSVNDAFGHTRGDEVLAELGRRVGGAIRESDLLFRFGGDEFIILLPGLSKDSACALGRRILRKIAAEPFAGDPPVSLSVSIGIAGYPEDTREPAELFEKADFRLLHAKRTGRGRLVAEDPPRSTPFHPDTGSRLLERESETETMHEFLRELPVQRRGVLAVKGKPGSGRTRFLRETEKHAALMGYQTIFVPGALFLKNKVLGAFKTPCEHLFAGMEDASRESEFLKRFIHAYSSRKLLLIVDNVHFLDKASLNICRTLFESDAFREFGIVFSTEPAKSVPGFPEWDAMRYEIALKPLRREALKIWLRSLLKWEAPDAFVTWMYRETKGFPAHVVKALLYLVKRDFLEKVSDGWKVNRNLETLRLGERAGIYFKAPTFNLPIFFTDFVGRTRELRELNHLLIKNRLITLVGPGGVGKTRLGLQLASENIPYFRDGVFGVPLASVSSAEFVVSAIGESLSLAFNSEGTLKDQLLHHLKTREALLFLDNFEHLMTETEIINDILEHCPEVRIIVTSRERLNLVGEWVFEVQGLAVPDDDAEPHPLRFSAVQLFVNAAARVDHRFKLTPDNTAAVIRICRQVNGLPLCIELAASWVRLLSCREIAGEIQSNLDLMETSQRDMPERHRSVRAVFENSWNLLSREEIDTFPRLAVFEGGFTRIAAREVAGATLQTLSKLLDKSLVYRAGEGRYHILLVIRQCALEKLAAREGEPQATGRKHAEFFAQYAEKMLRLDQEQKHREFTKAVASEIENIRRAWEFALQEKDVELLRRFIEALSLYYSDTGLSQEGKALFRRAIETLSGTEDNGDLPSREFSSVLGKLCSLCGAFHFNLSQYEPAHGYFVRALRCFKQIGDEHQQALSINRLGNIAARTGRYQLALKRHRKSLEIFRRIHDVRGISSALNNIGNILGSLGDNREAIRLYEESLKIARKTGNTRTMAALLSNMGITYGVMGELEKEKACLLESLELRKKINDPLAIAISLDNLANVYHFQGDLEKAESMHRESLELRRKIGDQWGAALSLLNIANVMSARGKTRRAEKYFDESLRIYRSIRDQAGLALVLNNLGMLHLERKSDGDLEKAEEYFRESFSIYRKLEDQWGIVLGLMNSGRMDTLNGAFKSAEARFREGLDIALKIQAVPLVLELIVCIAEWWVDDPEIAVPAAVQLLGFAESQPSASWNLKNTVKNVLKKVRKTGISPEQVATAMKAGGAMTRDDILESIERTMQ